ncbi:DmsC/YnfH family molybdoenzyme membrane anchor subunit [Sporomusa acidovorans]|uniref:DMSO reductase anchor subunit DmsC n=1 Tax=Sporomusa acidovorans (strain ATCC 49682 / DSM 3132 / Mol) TaxID=1123286 RepID=A0ABZ3JB90_SPOA4|nr:DmsC/YnfH family molybdoenzyme membrane anchor subunit [Sporomusa acidovorans]OZC21839.1 DMSO reductase anchor subunit DmsC [Sporomusa acidovorans DSM 3132]SDD55325.1 anaerobic dimethyl sulfoxide reductase subunit C (DMSO reductase anchor subunit) [Sporomusa acidovorans]
MSIQWPLVFFTLFIGLGCGTFVGSVILTEWYGRAKQIRTISAGIAIVSIGVGGMSSILHLGHPERMFGALGHPTSGIFMESTMSFLLGLAIIVYILALRRNASDVTCKIIGTVGAVLAVGLTFVNGDAYVMAAIPAWNTWILPTLYLTSAAVMGCFCIGVLVVRTVNYSLTTTTVTTAESAATTETAATTSMIRCATWIVLAMQAVMLVAYLIHIAIAPYPDVTRSVARVLAGNLALLFWGGLVLLGLLVPAALMTKFYTKNSEGFSLKLGLASVLAAGVAFRALMFLLGSSVKQFF